MMITYSLTQGTAILRSDGAIIPADSANADYQAYLAWIAAGNSASDGQLSSAQTAQIAANSAACQAAICAGFTSSALGSPYNYPSKVTDQQNLNASVVASLLPGIIATWVTPFWCEDSTGKWSYVYHSAAQIQKVGQDAKQAILNNLTKNAQLQASVMAATTVAEVKAITW